MSISFPNIDPVLVEIGPFAIRWYALAYVAGIVLGWWLLISMNKRQPQALTQKAQDDIMVWATLGIILGGRLGYVLFYNFTYYSANLSEIFKVWEGGMSFHGGMAGLLLAVYFLCRKEKCSFLATMDMVACVAPLGIFFGRLANFINGELFGRVSDVPWAIIFPRGGPLPRHPSQLYEAVLEGMVLFTILFLLAKFTRIREYRGMLGGLFLCGYALARMSVEQFREPDAQLGFVVGSVTMGQLLSLPMLLIGVALAVYAWRMKRHDA